MILKSLKLKNIRSYLSQEINFPTGSVLLSGDIGSGKSTILLAIEFALFGVKRKDLSGSSLLRHGKKEGEVELVFDLDEKEIIIKRKLKRAKEDIKQESGYIIKNGIKKEGTHIELKSDILDILGYPKELLTKSKDLVYRYTVYTPQDLMKQILLEDKDSRLDTLRKVFDIDKYKRIRENSQIYIRELKEKRKNYEGKMEDLEEKKRTKEEKEASVREFEEKLQKIRPDLEKAGQAISEKKQLLSKAEADIRKLNDLKKSLQLSELSLQSKLERRKRNNKEVDLLHKEMEKLSAEIGKKELTEAQTVKKDLADTLDQIKLMNNSLLAISKKITEFETKKSHSTTTKEKVSKIDECPTCLQKVTQEHKKAIQETEEILIKELDEGIKLHKEQEKNARKKLEELNNKEKNLRKREGEIQILLIKKESLKEKQGKIKALQEDQDAIKEEIGKINIKKIELSKELGLLKNIENEFKTAKEALEILQNNERKIAIQKRELEVKEEELTKAIKTLDEEIKRKTQIKKDLKKLSEYNNWLDEYFLNLMNTMEKNVMLQVYREFNDLFEQWFNILIEDETINVRLDDEFTPVIEQNGYETTIDNLSGGERTAVALAYRLALNRVINDIIGQIKTKDILMLDEPTDGFSTEQLDKIRVVLEQLNIKQVIIVSHETKIESFVDNVIRINKNEHISEVA
jgi:exonuclease SbcC